MQKVLDGKGERNATTARTEEKFPTDSSLIVEAKLEPILERLFAKEGFSKVVEQLSKSPNEADRALAKEIEKRAQLNSDDTNILLFLFKNIESFGSRDPVSKDFDVVTDTENTGKYVLRDPTTGSEIKGVVRYRKYLEVKKGFDINVAGPFTGIMREGVSRFNEKIKDAKITPGRTWVELKIKRGYTRKVRFAISDSLLNKLMDRGAFSGNAFEKLVQEIKIDVLQVKKNGECIADFELFMEALRDLHELGFDFNPIGRTTNIRRAGAGTLDDGSEFQVTIDSHIWQRDFVTGERKQAFPFKDPRNNRTYQFDPEFGMFTSVDPITKEPLWVYDSSTHMIYKVGKEGELVPQERFKLNDLKQVELKVDYKYKDFSGEDRARMPILNLLGQLRQKLIEKNMELNDDRLEENLGPIEIQRGKSSDFRRAELTPKKARVLILNDKKVIQHFSYNPQKSAFIGWDRFGKKALYILDVDQNKVYSLVKGTFVRDKEIQTISVVEALR